LAEPYPNPYPPLLGTPEIMRGWIVPPEMCKKGKNKIEIFLLEGSPVKIVYLDLGLK
jgi:hypothetical protein